MIFIELTKMNATNYSKHDDVFIITGILPQRNFHAVHVLNNP